MNLFFASFVCVAARSQSIKVHWEIKCDECTAHTNEPLRTSARVCVWAGDNTVVATSDSNSVEQKQNSQQKLKYFNFSELNWYCLELKIFRFVWLFVVAVVVYSFHSVNEWMLGMRCKCVRTFVCTFNSIYRTMMVMVVRRVRSIDISTFFFCFLIHE